jgi:uncharacterized protein YgiM (DUF1202 family)
MRIFAFLIMLLWGMGVQAETAQVTDTARVNMRSGKAENYRVIRVLAPRTEVEVIEVDQDYARVKTPEGETGWVLYKLLNPLKAETGKTGQIQAELDNAQKELVAVRVELANLQRELEKAQRQGPGESDKPLPFLLLLAFSAFASGIVIGALALKAYYQKRLHGLRI